MQKRLIIGLIIIMGTLFILLLKQDDTLIKLESNNINNNINNLAFFLQTEEESDEYTSVKTIPSKEDGYIFKKAVCTDNSKVTFNNTTWSIKISNMEQGEIKCKLYFDIDNAYARKYILSQNTINENTPDFNNLATANEGIFMAEDDTGTSYYYRGDVNNNYFYFAGYYWRIIRINGDGTLRLIYQGSTPTDNGIISSGKYNENTNDNAYMGYMYEKGIIHGTENSSTIKDILENWYENNIEEESKKYINLEQGFCNDRNNSTSSTEPPDNSGGIGTKETYYATRYRTFKSHEPTYKCSENDDLFTTASSSTGNKKLSQPVGLINVDEVVFAGGAFNKDNTSFYLNTGSKFWIMSPSHFSSNTGYNYNITENGNLYRSSVTTSLGIRPVININKNVKLEGDGTSTNPYIIKGNKIENIFAKDQILANKDIQQRNNFNSALANDTTNVIYETTDWKGTSYYFAGNPTDNWVKFGDFYWRIIRINGDGSIRLIYNGQSTNPLGENTILRNRGKFNVSEDRSEYVGLKYSLGEQHGQNTKSNVLNDLDKWYSDNLNKVSKYIDANIGFCSDRKMATSSWSSSTRDYYIAKKRIEESKQPTLNCNKEDILNIPIGLITADEAVYAGGGQDFTNENYYLYNDEVYWTMTPYSYYAGGWAGATVYVISSNISDNVVSNSWNIRPVINLKADTYFSKGNGTSVSPYEI